MNISIRSTLLAVAFAVTVAGAVTGLTIRGETKEASLDETCAHVTWPMIPADCLDGDARATRYISIDRIPGAEPMQLRFTIAFE